MRRIRVLIVDDAVVIRRMLSDCLAGDPGIEVVGTAPDGRIALQKLDQVNPDVVTLDMEMPVMDGLATLTELRKTHPRIPVIMFSTLTERGASATLDALARGASDYVTKPANVGSVTVAMQRIRDELVPKIRSLCKVEQFGPPGGAPRPAAPATAAFTRPGSPSSLPKLLDPIPSVRPEMLVIGVSTGGPNALAALLPGLARKFPVPIMIVQHMPPLFTRLLAERLASVSGMPAREGEAGAMLKPGEIWVAPGGHHMEVERTLNGLRIKLHDEAPENSCRPAVDVLFRSAARTVGSKCLGVILTGMGTDGVRGCNDLRDAGAQVLAQDEASSVVWGMPGAVARAGLANRVLPLSEMAVEINRRIPSGAAAGQPGIAPIPQPSGSLLKAA
jgi:two-component system chemotaxis response regulator CheB